MLVAHIRKATFKAAFFLKNVVWLCYNKMGAIMKAYFYDLEQKTFAGGLKALAKFAELEEEKIPAFIKSEIKNREEY